MNVTDKRLQQLYSFANGQHLIQLRMSAASLSYSKADLLEITKWKKTRLVTHLLKWPKSQWHHHEHWWGHGAAGTLTQCWWECKWCSHFGRRLEVSYKTQPTLTSNHAPWYLLKELNTSVLTKTCPRMCTAALFIIATTWKQPGCPIIGKWIYKLWYIQPMEYYLVIKKGAIKPWKSMEEP